jgi:hypothetical protein
MTKDKAKLEEVKAILHELQRIRPDLATLDKEPRAEPGAPAPAPAVVNGARRAPAFQEAAAASPPRSPERPAAPAPAGGMNKGLLAAGGGVAVIAAVAGAMFMLNQQQKHRKDPEQVAAISPAAAPTAERAASSPDASLNIVQHAQKLMSDGDIKGARQALLQPAESGYPDAAFSLARSYDPNFLQTVTNPNAGPDVAQAEIWYRRWHEAAVKQGMVTDSLRLERILRSMH